MLKTINIYNQPPKGYYRHCFTKSCEPIGENESLVCLILGTETKDKPLDVNKAVLALAAKYGTVAE